MEVLKFLKDSKNDNNRTTTENHFTIFGIWKSTKKENFKEYLKAVGNIFNLNVTIKLFILRKF
jgi:hypothetical protein